MKYFAITAALLHTSTQLCLVFCIMTTNVPNPEGELLSSSFQISDSEFKQRVRRCLLTAKLMSDCLMRIKTPLEILKMESHDAQDFGFQLNSSKTAIQVSSSTTHQLCHTELSVSSCSTHQMDQLMYNGLDMSI